MKKTFIYLFIYLFIIRCENNHTIKKSWYEKGSVDVVGRQKYDSIYGKLQDSVRCWIQNKLGYYQYCGETKNCFIDSLLCFNTVGNRFIAAKLLQQLNNDEADGIDFMYGEEINNKWYFFEGAHVVIPRELIKNHPINQPLSYQQLHQRALREVYNGYLNSEGKINEEWFTYDFEGAGWGDPNYTGAKTRSDSIKIKDEYYKLCHIRKSMSIWYSKWNICSLYRNTDIKPEYIKEKQQLKITLPIKAYDNNYLYNDSYYLGYNIDNKSLANSNEYPLTKEQEKISFYINHVPNTCNISVELTLSQTGRVDFTATIKNGIVSSIKLKKCKDVDQIPLP